MTRGKSRPLRGRLVDDACLNSTMARQRHALPTPCSATRSFRVAEYARRAGPVDAAPEQRTVVALGEASLSAPLRRLNASWRLCFAARSTGLDGRMGDPPGGGCARRAVRPPVFAAAHTGSTPLERRATRLGSAERSAPFLEQAQSPPLTESRARSWRRVRRMSRRSARRPGASRSQTPAQFPSGPGADVTSGLASLRSHDNRRSMCWISPRCVRDHQRYP